MKKFLFVSMLLLIIGAFIAIQSVTAASVTPVYYEGNPTCKDLGYEFNYKVDPPNGGAYVIDAFNQVTVDTADGVYFDWSATLGIDAVIVKGGNNANVYVYDPEAMADTALHSPLNPNNGTPYALSHMDFCFDYEVSVVKTAETSFTRTFDWTIDKTVAPATWDLFTGDSGVSFYTVAVEKTGFTDSAWAVNGVIEVANHTPFDAQLTSIADAISGFAGPVAPSCGVDFPYTLASGAVLTCTYATPLPDGADRTNTATVTASGTVGGGIAQAAVAFGEPSTLVNDTITVSDTNGSLWENVTGSQEWSYDRTFTCDADQGNHTNTAAIVETGAEAQADVTVNCHALQVTKTAATAFTRTFNWTVDKSADQTDLTLAPGQQFLVNYTVVIGAASTDSDWAAAGGIQVSNPAPLAAVINSLSDVVSGDIPAQVICPVSFPYTLPAGETLDCTYTAALPDAAARTNHAEAVLQNYRYSGELILPDGETSFSGSAPVSFDQAQVTQVDTCIDVNDSLQGFLGTVCFDSAPATFTYSRTIGPYPVCGQYTVDNTAGFVANDTGATGSDSWSVAVDVPCGACTLTPGYWKTHSRYGPAPYDDNWANLGEDTPFYLSGLSYYQALWTAPAGNPYYILAHAYIAAYMNTLNGSPKPPEVAAALTWADNFFKTYPPSVKLSRSLREQLLLNATLLDNYNNGLIGPGHCDF
ncbi:MAG: hypothetical protein ACKOC5_00300 [Chloroflexota bacterium]